MVMISRYALGSLAFGRGAIAGTTITPVDGALPGPTVFKFGERVVVFDAFDQSIQDRHRIIVSSSSSRSEVEVQRVAHPRVSITRG